jgi:hypothetical protein
MARRVAQLGVLLLCAFCSAPVASAQAPKPSDPQWSTAEFDQWAKTLEPAASGAARRPFSMGGPAPFERLPANPPTVSSAAIHDSDSAQTSNAPGAPQEWDWRDRQFSAGYLIGVLAGDPFHSRHPGSAVGPLLAKRYGWDFSDYWGLDIRVADAWLGDSTRLFPGHDQTEHVLFADANLAYYPWGNARWRPYALVGAGVADFGFRNDHNHHLHRLLADLPFGLGVKYPLNKWLTVRAELLDSVVIGDGGLHTMNNVSLALGLDVRFGDPRKHWPWKR